MFFCHVQNEACFFMCSMALRLSSCETLINVPTPALIDMSSPITEFKDRYKHLDDRLEDYLIGSWHGMATFDIVAMPCQLPVRQSSSSHDRIQIIDANNLSE